MARKVTTYSLTSLESSEVSHSSGCNRIGICTRLRTEILEVRLLSSAPVGISGRVYHTWLWPTRSEFESRISTQSLWCKGSTSGFQPESIGSSPVSDTTRGSSVGLEQKTHNFRAVGSSPALWTIWNSSTGKSVCLKSRRFGSTPDSRTKRR